MFTQSLPTIFSSTMDAVSHGAEVSQFHARTLRTSLVVEESRIYWARSQDNIPRENRAIVAFEERWFGGKSMARVQTLLTEFGHRFDAYPMALEVLRQWCPSDLATRQNICHWHLQLIDPLYRDFAGTFLEQRRSQLHPSVDRDVTVRWVKQKLDDKWAAVTTIRMATSLITAATSAGLCSDNQGTRTLKYPRVSDEALAYWLYFLKDLKFEGTLLTNSYLASVGLSEDFLEQRLLRLPGISFSRMGDLLEFTWHHPNLKIWAIKELELTWEDAP